MKSMFKDKRGISLNEAPAMVMIVGFIFLMMATVAYISDQYGESLTAGSIAANVTDDLENELLDNTSIAGIVLTIGLVGIVLTILISIFVASKRGGL